jgi:hypothetical protein
MINYRHSGSLGDVIYSIPAIISQKQEASLFLWDSVPGNFYHGCRHPAGNFRMSKEGAEWLIPLLRLQPVFDNVELWKADREIDIDLDRMRRLPGMTYQWGSIPRWYFYVVPGFYDLSQPWLFARPHNAFEKSIVVNRTSRYRNNNIKYEILEDVDADIVFIGLEEEYKEFIKEVPRAKFHKCEDASEMASVINSALMFIGNQSVAYAIAEGLKVNRVLETCLWAPNIIPTGGLCYDAIQQRAFDFAVGDCLEKSYE